MAKWYRFSFSLAAKCQIGFAAAVLLIIAVTLYVPYIWMDKLVEQGKQELAKTELQHVLELHFQPPRDTRPSSPNPPLALSEAEEESIMPARWVRSEKKEHTSPAEVDLYVLAPREMDTASLKEMDLAALQPRPVTHWIPLYSLLPNGPTEPADTKADPLPDSISQDSFLRKGIRKFIKHKHEVEIFELKEYPPEETAELDPNEKQGFFSDFLALRPSSQPSRYLRAIRAEKSCLTGGCHAPAAAADAEAPPTFTEGQLVGAVSVLLPPGQTSITLLFNRIFIVLAGLLSCICAVITFYLITQRFILQPMRALRDAAEHVTLPSEEPADPGQDPKESWQKAISITQNIKTGDEYERLAQAFHHMLERLKIAHDRLRETNRALDMRLGDLEAKNVALFESNKLKSEFLANVSHELRTPLNAILGFAEIMKEQAQQRDDPKTVRYAANVLDSGHMLLGIINDLLDLAKMEAGKMEVHWARCSLPDILEVLLNFTRPLVEQKKLTLTHTLDPALGLIETDPGKLQQILFNLLSNAIKFTPEGGQIEIEAKVVFPLERMRDLADLTEGRNPAEPIAAGEPAMSPAPSGISLAEAERQRLQISIADTGPGIPEEQQEIIFEKFHQLDASVTREHTGAGLGLAIVKDLLEMLGGSITVRNRRTGGSIFTVQLPIQKRSL